MSVPNPLQCGLELVNRAVQADQQNQLKQACELYEQSLMYLKQAWERMLFLLCEYSLHIRRDKPSC